MPTKKQLHLMWEAQIEFFGGAGVPKQIYQGHTENNGLTVENPTDIPIVPKSHANRPKGQKVGELVYDPEHKGLKIVIDKK